MKTLSRNGVLLSAAALAFLTQAAQKPPPPPADSSPSALLASAATTIGLGSPDTPPYRLQAHVKYFGEGKKATEGELTLIWAAPDRWRMETRWGDVSHVQVANHDRIWRTPTDAFRLDDLRLEHLLQFAAQLKTLPGKKLSEGSDKNLSGVRAICFHEIAGTLASAPGFPSDLLRREFCLERVSHLPVRIGNTRQQYSFLPGDYLSLGPRRFPRHLSYRANGKEEISIDVDSLEEVTSLPEDAFSAPQGTTSLPWCPGERDPRVMSFSGGGSGPPLRFSIPGSRESYPIVSMEYVFSRLSLLVFDVGTDGHVKSLAAFDQKGGDVSGKPFVQKLRDSRFYPAICGERIVEGEFFIVRSRR